MTLAPKLFASLLLVILYFLVRRNEPRSCWLQKAMINQTMLRSSVHRYVMNYNGDSNNRRFDALDRPSAKNLNQSFLSDQKLCNILEAIYWQCTCTVFVAVGTN